MVEENKVIDFKKIKKEKDDSRIINESMEFSYETLIQAAKLALLREDNTYDSKILDTKEGKEKFYKAFIKAAKDPKMNLLYNLGRFKDLDVNDELKDQLAMSALGLDPSNVKKQIYEYGRAFIPNYGKLVSNTDEIKNLKAKRAKIPYNKLKQSDLEGILKEITPSGKKFKKDEGPITIADGVIGLDRYIENEGMTPGDAKQLGYTLQDAA